MWVLSNMPENGRGTWACQYAGGEERTWECGSQLDGLSYDVFRCASWGGPLSVALYVGLYESEDPVLDEEYDAESPETPETEDQEYDEGDLVRPETSLVAVKQVLQTIFDTCVTPSIHLVEKST